MLSCAVFDLDGTLAERGEAVGQEELFLLKELEGRGVTLALSSGKPCFYLCGFARQMGLKEAYLIGENGAVLQYGVELPPRVTCRYPIPEKTKNALTMLRREMEERFPDGIWYQPNETALTPFPHDPALFPPLRELLARRITEEMELWVCEHSDCFDVQYAPLSKATGISLLSQVTGIDPKNMAAVGDWTNDYPMFEAVGFSVGIHLPEPQRATVNVPDLKSALLELLKRC